MPSRSAFQFLHAADLALDAPVFGVADLPEPARDVLLDARYLAAQRVFDTALEAGVDFVVLAGNVLGNGYGVRAACFLNEQFSRLKQAGIPVYWVEQTATGPVEWPGCVSWPDTVMRADANLGQIWTVMRDDRPLARVVACRAGARRQPKMHLTTAGHPELFEIHVMPFSALQAPSDRSASYWALGGQPAAVSVPGTGGRARFCGQPQGRHPGEVGPRGCQLVTVDPDGSVFHQFVETNAVRWYCESVAVDSGFDRLSFRTAAESRYRRIASETSAPLAIVRWDVTGHGDLMQSLHDEAASGELLSWLRGLAPDSPTIWSLSVETTASAARHLQLESDEHPLAAAAAELERLEADDPRLQQVLEEVATHFGEDLSVPAPKFLDRIRKRARAEVLRRIGNSDS
ncbi:MAG: exonuclease SbcCD subunit D, partial [Maioricimonas sp. JB049]